MTDTALPPPLGVALIGAGMIGPSHVAALSAMGAQVQLRTVVTRTPQNATCLAQHYAGPTPLFTADLAQVTGDPAIQMAIVATPANVRLDLIAALAQAGKHILLEKPVARTTPEARQVVDICEAAGVTLGVVFQHRMRASSRAAARHVAAGLFGRLGHVEIAAPLWRPQSYYDTLGRGTYDRDGGGVLITQAIHTIDLALSLTGPVTQVQAMTATTPLHRMEAEDLAVAGLRFANGAVGSLVASTASFPHGAETVTLHYERASMRLGREALQISWREDVIDPPVLDAGDAGRVVAKHEWHQGVITDFVTALHTGRPPLVTGRQALAAHQLIDAIETSSRSQRAVAVVP